MMHFRCPGKVINSDQANLSLTSQDRQTHLSWLCLYTMITTLYFDHGLSLWVLRIVGDIFCGSQFLFLLYDLNIIHKVLGNVSALWACFGRG